MAGKSIVAVAPHGNNAVLHGVFSLKATGMKAFPRQGKRATWYYIAMLNGTPVVRDGQLPVFWHRRVAREEFKDWKGVTIARCRVEVHSDPV